MVERIQEKKEEVEEKKEAMGDNYVSILVESDEEYEINRYCNYLVFNLFFNQLLISIKP